jgi:Tfp pilus assembly protein PilX
MNSGKKSKRTFYKNESGVALVTVVMISVLLGIACIAILSAVGAHSRNVTDVLSENKAYYAAESGLQATINVLRGNTDTTADTTDNINYSKAALPSLSNYSGDPSTTARLSNWMTYNYPTTGTANRIVIGEAANVYNPNTGVAYSIEVSDPDNTINSLTFNTSGSFVTGSSGTITNSGKTISYPDNTSANRIEITFTDAPSTTIDFLSSHNNPRLGSFTMVTVGSGATIPSTAKLDFRIDYRLTAPRTDTRSIYGSIIEESAVKKVKFQTRYYKSVGSTIELCSGTTGGPGCTDFSPNLTTTPTNNQFYAYITPVEPYRLRVVSTGYGPNGARKRLEGFLQRDLFNGLSSGAATTMIGTSVGMTFNAGNSNGISYSGGNCATSTGCVPSFGLTNPQSLQYVIDHPPGPGSGDPTQMQPPPALLDSSNTPSWQQSPAALDALVNQLRTVARNSPGSYFVNPTGNQNNFNVGSNQNPPGSYTNGTGITFCEGSCKISADGGGILVVTGKLTNVGNFHFKGMIIVTGEEGWERNGAGGGEVIGNVIIAPYNRSTYYPQNLSSTFLAPQYNVTGGGVSTITYADTGNTLNNTAGVSDLMLGVGEK